MVDDIVALGVDVDISAIRPHRLFSMAESNKDGALAEQGCSKVASFYTDLLIRHGYALLL